jgi:alkylhydroperoxidase family enzyme
MDLRLYEVATLGAVRHLRSSYCALAHGSVLLRLTGEQPVIDIMTDLGHLDQTDRAVVALAEKVATAAAEITEQDIQRARDAGLSDDDILNVVLAAAARCFFSKVLDGTGTQADSELRTQGAAESHRRACGWSPDRGTGLRPIYVLTGGRSR